MLSHHQVRGLLLASPQTTITTSRHYQFLAHYSTAKPRPNDHTGTSLSAYGPLGHCGVQHHERGPAQTTSYLAGGHRHAVSVTTRVARPFAITRWPGQNFRACGIHRLPRSEHLNSTDVASATDHHDQHPIDLVQIALSRQPFRQPMRPISTSNLHHSLFVVFYLHQYISPFAAWATVVPRGHELPSAACIGPALSSLPSCGHILTVT